MKTYFRLLQEEIFQAYKNSRQIRNSVPTGLEREVITSRFLARHLPSFAEIGQGVLIDQSTTDFSLLTQSTSPQIDILLTMGHHPRLTLYGGTKFFFAESVAAIIEVKSKLTCFESTEKSESELDAILKHCFKVKQRSRQILGLFFGSPEPSTKVPYYVVAFESDKRGGELFEALKKRGDKEGLTDEQKLTYQPDGIFVIDPDNSTVTLKHVADHEIRPAEFSSPCFASGTYTDGGALMLLWLTLFHQINRIKHLDFPFVSYAKQVLSLSEKI